MTARLEPFLLDPVPVERPWGGRRLEAYGKALPAETMIGESWEVADLPDHVAPTVDDPRSRVATGPFRGDALADLIERAGEELLGPVRPTDEGRFPLLVKLLDAREHLSVQAHPHADYVSTHPEARLKTESWYIIAAEPGADLYLDLVDGTTPEDTEAVMGSRDIVPYLRSVPAESGAFHHVPAGLVHALGAGVMVAEVQTPSDTTFRIYDWAAEYRRAPRDLHPVQALASIRLHPADAYSLAPSRVDGVRELASNDYYWIREHRSAGGAVDLAGLPGPKVIMVVEGRAALDGLEPGLGSTAIVPAVASGTRVTAAGRSTLLEIGIPV